MSQLFWCLLIGFGYGVAFTLVALAIGKGIKVGHGPAPAAPELPAPVEPPAAPPVDAGLDLLADQPVEILSGAALHDRFRQIIQPEFTWEQWA